MRGEGFTEIPAQSQLETERETLGAKELLERLSPETFEDEEGIERTLFTFECKGGGSVKAMFYRREELPAVGNILEGKQATVFGEEPRHRKKDEWGKLVSSIGERSTKKDTRNKVLNPGIVDTGTLAEGNAVFVVEQNMKSLLDMAFVLGVENPKLRKLRSLISEGKTNDEVERFVDQVIAGKVLDDEGVRKDVPDQEGETLFLLGLMGNEDASRILEQKRMQLVRYDEARDNEHLVALKEGAERMTREQPLKLKELIAVHLTKFMPRQSEARDAWELQTSYEATGKKMPRITQHFTLNHPIVAAGAYGSWEDASIAVLMPLDRMIERNGKPSLLNTVDTFWEVSPGRRTILPKDDAWLVKPGAIEEEGKLVEHRGHELTYKSKNFGPEDVKALAKSWKEPYEREGISHRIREIFANAVSTYEFGKGYVPTISNEDFHHLVKTFGAKELESLEGTILGIRRGEGERDLLPELSEKPIREVVEGIFEEASIYDRIGKETIERIVKDIETEFIFRTKQFVIAEQIRALGYTVHGGGMWAWDGDSWTATDRTVKLGAEIGVLVGPHSGHESHDAESFLMSLSSELETGEETPAAYREALGHVSSPDYFRKLSQPMRRLLYEIGAL
ncbi:MAG: hypothetical protein V1696_02120 [Candidatus Jorgensenbacteria bacterium]